ncbi:MAG: hypothetical protein JOZ18_05190 [Chloroflexi bacterium]|nr:hypothetical protein [Chloroflexota bacterium]
MAIEKYLFDDEHHNYVDDSEQQDKITIELSLQMRKRVKQAAHKREISAKQYLEQTLEQAVPEEEMAVEQESGTITREAIARLRRIREQIIQDRQGKLFEGSTELIRQMREERIQELEQR